MKLKLYLFKKELFFFLLAHALGIYIAARFLSSSLLRIRLDFSLLDFLILLAVLLVVMFFISVFKKRAWFFRFFFVAIIFLGAQTVFAAFVGEMFSYAFALFLILALFAWRRIFLHNLAVALAIAGVGGIIGLSFSPTVAIIILALFSFYDIIAVYKTKHMVKMAEGMIESGAVFGLILTSKEPRDFMILGSGDILLPLILAASVAASSVFSAAIISMFAAMGLFVTHILFSNQQKRKPMAALPPIATLSIIGYLVAILL